MIGFVDFLVPELPKGPHYGVLAEFTSPGALIHACEKVRDSGYTRWDTHTPFPVHGLEPAMGLGRSRLPFVTLIMGLTGALSGITLQLWASGIAYPLVISGKPVFNWQPFVPITFELGVLFAAISTVVAMFAFNQLPMLFHPLFSSPNFARATDDAFFISIESWDPKFHPEDTQRFLQGLGAVRTELIAR